jgi:RNA polymerase sigma factor (sigma-70 family)
LVPTSPRAHAAVTGESRSRGKARAPCNEARGGRTCRSGEERETIRASSIRDEPKGDRILDAATIAAICRGFRDGESGDVETVRGWIRAVVHGGNWRFADSQAVVQEVLVELVRTVRTRPIVEPGGFLKMVRTVSKNVCVDTYHRERRGAAEPLDAERAASIAGGGDPEGRMRARERISALAYVLQRLGNPCRELWTLVYGERLASGEVARRLGTTDGNVRVRMHRCLERARTIAREYGERSPA